MSHSDPIVMQLYTLYTRPVCPSLVTQLGQRMSEISVKYTHFTPYILTRHKFTVHTVMGINQWGCGG